MLLKIGKMKTVVAVNFIRLCHLVVVKLLNNLRKQTIHLPVCLKNTLKVNKLLRNYDCDTFFMSFLD